MLITAMLFDIATSLIGLCDAISLTSVRGSLGFLLATIRPLTNSIGLEASDFPDFNPPIDTIMKNSFRI